MPRPYVLSVPFATHAEALAQYAASSDVPGAKRSIFHRGFPPDEEAGVLDRLRGLVDPS